MVQFTKEFEQSFEARAGLQFFNHVELEAGLSLGNGFDSVGKYVIKTRTLIFTGRYRF